MKSLRLLIGLATAAFTLAGTAAALATPLPPAPTKLATDDDTTHDDAPADAGSEDADPAEDENAPADDAPADDAEPDTAEPAGKPSADQADQDEQGETDKPQADKPSSAKRDTHRVAAKRLKIDVQFDGIFVADQMTPVVLQPDAWSRFEIEKIVPHGSKVHAGQVLVQFDDEKINQALDELELEQRLSELAIRKAQQELPRLEKLLEMNAEVAERTDQYAQTDLDRYEETDRPMLLKSIEYMMKSARFSLESAQEELEQLEKMYEADDLTEETEEIVLRRQRMAVDFAEFNLESSEVSRDQMLEVQLPRNDIRIRDAVERAELALTKARTALEVDLHKARYELEKQKQARTKSLERHAELVADRDRMKITAPVDGVVYYGQCQDGMWADMANMIKKLEPHNAVSPGTVMMTVVEPRPMHVRAKAEQEKRADLEVGQPARIKATDNDRQPLAARLDRIAAVPVSGKFDLTCQLESDEPAEWIVPGVSCQVEVRTYDEPAALLVPKQAVHRDAQDDEQQYVWLVDPEDEHAQPERRSVETGKTSGEQIEILAGLEEGDVVSLDDEN